MFWQEKSSKLISIFALWKFKQKLNLCFDKGSQSDQYLQVTYYILSDQICFLTEKIQNIELTFLFWQAKSSNFICNCVLKGKIQHIDMNFRFDVKIQTNLFEFVFWQRISIWSIFTGYLLYFSNQIYFLTRKVQKIVLNLVFWQVKSNKFIF